MIPTNKLLESKGFKVKEENVETLEMQWKALQAAKSAIELDYLKESKMGLTNVPGGDQID